jgi:hypothetical protein
VAARVVKPKRTCCKSSPRCKRCPVVCKRLANAGLAERLDDGRYLLDPGLRKKQLKAARKKKSKLARA